MARSRCSDRRRLCRTRSCRTRAELERLCRLSATCRRRRPMTRRGWLLLAAWCGLLALGVAWVQHAAHGVGGSAPVHAVAAHRGAAAAGAERRRKSGVATAVDRAVAATSPRCWPRSRRNSPPRWRATAEFGLVANGEQAPLAIPENLLAVSLPDHRLLRRAPLDAAPPGGGARRSRRRHGLAGGRRCSRSGCRAIPRSSCCTWPRAGSRASSRTACDDVWFTADGSAHCCWLKRALRPSIPMGRRARWRRCAREFERARGDSHGHADGQRLGLLLVHHQESHPDRGHLVRRRRHARHDPADVDRVPPSRLHLVRRVAAGVGGARGTGRGQRAVRQRARHHAGLRLHADRRRAGLSACTCSVISRRGQSRARHRAPGVARRWPPVSPAPASPISPS